MAVITISRELGSEGDTIIDLLCDRLGYCRVDKAVLAQIAQGAGVDVQAVVDKERDLAQKPKLFSEQMTSLYGRAPTAFARKSGMDDQTYARVVRETLEQYARAGNAIIVGRGGQMILHDWPGTLHVQIHAPVELRVRRLMNGLSISELEAKRRITASDEQKRLLIRNAHQNANWKDLKYYDLTINTARISPEVAAEIIIQAAQHIDS